MRVLPGCKRIGDLGAGWLGTRTASSFSQTAQFRLKTPGVDKHFRTMFNGAPTQYILHSFRKYSGREGSVQAVIRRNEAHVEGLANIHSGEICRLIVADVVTSI